MRAVIDTNILVRALIKPQGSVGLVLLRLRAGDYVLLYSEATLAELVDVLNRPRIRDKYHLSDEDIETVVRLILLRGEVALPIRRIAVCRDPKDDKFLEVAVDGRADVIVSGDEDLRVLNPFEGVPIVEPRSFLDLLARR
ncbi:MAG: putative toxin-antitoxin system toxin component, PIN family [Chloroflexota bacterium]